MDTGQVFLNNAGYVTELPGVKLDGLTAEQKKSALRRLNTENCTCGCTLTLSECRINDTTCPVSIDIAAKVDATLLRASKLKASKASPQSLSRRRCQGYPYGGRIGNRQSSSAP